MLLGESLNFSAMVWVSLHLNLILQILTQIGLPQLVHVGYWAQPSLVYWNCLQRYTKLYNCAHFGYKNIDLEIIFRIRLNFFSRISPKSPAFNLFLAILSATFLWRTEQDVCSTAKVNRVCFADNVSHIIIVQVYYFEVPKVHVLMFSAISRDFPKKLLHMLSPLVQNPNKQVHCCNETNLRLH